jgi:hypothetical protein
MVIKTALLNFQACPLQCINLGCSGKNVKKIDISSEMPKFLCLLFSVSLFSRRIRHTTGNHLIHHTPAQLAEPPERLPDILFHFLVHPVHNLTEAFAFIKTDNYFLVLSGNDFIF